MKPINRVYKAGSIIYFAGELSKDIYVLQQGGINLISESIDGKNETTERVQKGEFFGVKSSLGHYPREETARALVDSTVLVFNPVSFENFALKNSRVVLQMLKVFSSSLRKIHQKVRDLLGEATESDTSNELLMVGEYYHKKNNFSYSAYVYKSYLTNYPSGVLAERAKKMLDLASAQKSYPPRVPTILQELQKISGGDVPETFSASQTSQENQGSAKESNEKEGGEVTQMYFDAMNALSAEDLKTAENKLKTILNMPTVPVAEEEYLHKALYDLARVYVKDGKLKEGLDGYSKFIRKYPRSALLRKAMNGMAAIYEEKNNMTKAIGFYQAVSKMTPEDKDSIAAMNKLKELKK